MKKICTILVMFFIAFTFLFTGCSPKGLENNPETGANVVSNGGMTVVKGDYLYYVNGYLDSTTLGNNDNEEGKIVHSGIYRTKLNNGTIVKDNDGFVTETERVVSKVVGFDNGGFYIIDDFIYYATPYMKLNSEGVLQSDRVEYHRINIDGTKDEILYITEAADENLDWTIYKTNSGTYLVLYVNSKLISVDCSNGKVVATIENSTSYALYKETDYATSEDRTNETLNYVYYTRAIDTQDNAASSFKGNVVCKFNVSTGEVKVVNSADKDYTYSIKDITESSVYYSKLKTNGLELLYKKDLDKSWGNSTEIKLTNDAYTDYHFCDFGNNVLLVSDGSTTKLIKNGVATQILSSSRTIVGIYGNYAYYVDSNKLFRFDINGEVVNGNVEVETVTNENSVNIITDDKFVDFDNQRVYVYTQYTAEKESNNYYLNFISEREVGTQEFVGKFEDDHLPAKPEQSEEENAEYIPWID